MRITNQTYDVIKWIAVNFIPAFEVLILALGNIWNIPYFVEIGATVAAVGVFLAAIIGISNKTYQSDQELGIIYEDEDTEVDDD